MKFSLGSFLLSISLLVSLSSCTEYWWTRGQPPASNEVLQRAIDRLAEVEVEYPDKRPEIAEAAKKFSSHIEQIISLAGTNPKSTTSVLEKLELELMALEGKLSYGNRAPLSELSGQFRSFKGLILEKGPNSVPSEVFSLFGARLLFMLSSEMKVPPVDPIKAS